MASNEILKIISCGKALGLRSSQEILHDWVGVCIRGCESAIGVSYGGLVLLEIHSAFAGCVCPSRVLTVAERDLSCH